MRRPPWSGDAAWVIADRRATQRQTAHPNPRTARAPAQSPLAAFRAALHDFHDAPTVERFRTLQHIGETLDAARAARADS
jgi:isopenicillin N synthase-like dioxygenase